MHPRTKNVIMDLKEILTISGYSGLYKMISQTRNGVIVESLIDKKRMPAYASYKISSLEDIAVFTADGEVRLAVVIKNIYEKENGGPAGVIAKATNEQVKAYFAEVLPEYDRNRVYVSDMKRLFTWYNLLQSLNLIDIETVKEEAQLEITPEESNDLSDFAAVTATSKGGEEEEIQLNA